MVRVVPGVPAALRALLVDAEVEPASDGELQEVILRFRDGLVEVGKVTDYGNAGEWYTELFDVVYGNFGPMVDVWVTKPADDYADCLRDMFNKLLTVKVKGAIGPVRFDRLAKCYYALSDVGDDSSPDVYQLDAETPEEEVEKFLKQNGMTEQDLRGYKWIEVQDYVSGSGRSLGAMHDLRQRCAPGNDGASPAKPRQSSQASTQRHGISLFGDDPGAEPATARHAALAGDAPERTGLAALKCIEEKQPCGPAALKGGCRLVWPGPRFARRVVASAI